MPKEIKVTYFCDGKVENCQKTHCYKNGGECHHTYDIAHAIYFSHVETDTEILYFEEEDINWPDVDRDTPLEEI